MKLWRDKIIAWFPCAQHAVQFPSGKTVIVTDVNYIIIIIIKYLYAEYLILPTFRFVVMH